ncbi:MAG: spermidine/putrescine ABC transporter ATP-binding protein [Actinobacteria bacterium RBG_16_67_15]|nr:MAG: spermidine/putrescine ABC transporter ATP-binding protein [Actinobacteria bacterium RBG_16_67_15]
MGLARRGCRVTTPAVSLVGVSKHFGDVVAVDGVSLEVQDGEFFSLLGPSGSGKTTCLRMIAGFEEPTAGTVLLHGADVTGQAPYQRDVNTVFQDYALFPHMTVAENVGYGPMVRGAAKDERARRVGEALDMVHLGAMGDRKPGQLSGGQRQRVALARALINRPRVILLDEPLGALDLKLRHAMQIELKSIQRDVGITFVYVTHDQEEALNMSDRLAVFNHGRIEQVGPPQEVYETPHTAFVAGFVGVSNVVSANLAEALTGRADAFTVRPEKISLHVSGAPVTDPSTCDVSGTVVDVIYLGMFTRYAIEVGHDTTLEVVRQNLDAPHRERGLLGATVHLQWARESCRYLSEGSTEEHQGGKK